MKVHELIDHLKTMPPNAEVLTDNIGFTKLEPLREPRVDYAIISAGEYLSCRQGEDGATVVVYIEAPGVS